MIFSSSKGSSSSDFLLWSDFFRDSGDVYLLLSLGEGLVQVVGIIWEEVVVSSLRMDSSKIPDEWLSLPPAGLCLCGIGLIDVIPCSASDRLSPLLGFEDSYILLAASSASSVSSSFPTCFVGLHPFLLCLPTFHFDSPLYWHLLQLYFPVLLCFICMCLLRIFLLLVKLLHWGHWNSAEFVPCCFGIVKLSVSFSFS